jgi:4-amino-4-deoxychorismate lyase
MLQRLCIETIAVENRQFKNLAYHEARLNKTREDLWGLTDSWKLSELIEIPDSVSHGLYKCRVAYSEAVDNIQWEPYKARNIQSIKLVYDNEIDYTYKYDKRPELNVLFAQRGNADEILIIKNGMVTDTYVHNVALFDGSKWFTPDTCLLRGSQRASLLDRGIIETRSIAENDLYQYSHIKLFNAMIGWEEAPVIAIADLS